MSEREAMISNNKGKIPIYCLLVSAYFFSYFFRVSASVSLPAISTEWGMSASLVGFISSLYFYAYAFMQPISGALNDRFGPLRIVSLGMLTTGIGALLFGFASNPTMLGVGRLLTGFGLAPMLSGVLVYQSHSFHRDKYSFFSGITYTLGNFGAVISVAPLAFALDEFGRRNVFVFLAFLNFALAASLIAFRRRDPVISIDGKIERKGFLDNLKNSFRKILRSRQLKLMLVLWGTSFGALMSLQGLWAVSWYQTSYGVSYGTASLWSTLISIGVMVGNFVGAYIARPARLRLPALWCFVGFLLVFYEEPAADSYTGTGRILSGILCGYNLRSSYCRCQRSGSQRPWRFSLWRYEPLHFHLCNHFSVWHGIPDAAFLFEWGNGD